MERLAKQIEAYVDTIVRDETGLGDRVYDVSCNGTQPTRCRWYLGMRHQTQRVRIPPLRRPGLPFSPLYRSNSGSGWNPEKAPSSLSLSMKPNSLTRIDGSTCCIQGPFAAGGTRKRLFRQSFATPEALISRRQGAYRTYPLRDLPEAIPLIEEGIELQSVREAISLTKSATLLILQPDRGCRRPVDPFAVERSPLSARRLLGLYLR